VTAPEDLRSMFALLPTGDLVWLRPSKYHPDLLARTAGGPITNHAGKVYWHIQIDGKKIKRSHIVFCLTHGRWPVGQIDHINGDSADDRASNLREATPTQNAWNHKRRSKKSPLPMGVRRAMSGRYVARIAVNKRQITIGTYDTPGQAQRAYLAARFIHFGEFA
jgi:hypothetical protein